jgi:PAS domain S-box-containing protein
MSNETKSFLLVARSAAEAARIRAALGRDPELVGAQIIVATNEPALEEALPTARGTGPLGRRAASRVYDVVISQLGLEGLEPAAMIDRLRASLPGTPIVLLTTDADVELAAEIGRDFAAPIAPSDDRYLALLTGVVRAQLQAERALSQSEARFERIAENAPDMIFRWSYARGFEYVSPSSVDVIGYTPEEHYADPGLGYRSIYLEDVPIYESVFSDFADPEGPRRYCVIRWHHKEGHTVHVEMRMTPLFDEHGNLLAVEGIARDISQHVRARERLRELTARLTNAHEEERRRIAHELHDEVGQALTIAKMRMQMARNALPEDADDVRDRLEMLDELIRETLQDVRALSHELRPPLLDEMGWEPALESLCESFSQRTGLPVTFISPGDYLRLDPDSELVAYRVVQEALTNTVRHAQAREAVVRAAMHDDKLDITIEDDGIGFDIDAIMQTDYTDVGIGLLGMRERVDTVGGEIDLTTSPGNGTRIHLVLPRKEEPI